MAEASFEVQLGGRTGVDAVDASEAAITYGQHEKNSEGHLSRSAEGRHRMIWYEGLGQYIGEYPVLQIA